MEQFVLIELLTLYLAILLHPQAFLMTCEVQGSSDMSKSESWDKTTEGPKGSKTKKALFSENGCKLSALCLHKRQNREKGGWMEKHTKEEDSRGEQLYPSPPASPPFTANSPIISPAYFRCLTTRDCLFPVMEYGWLTLTSRILYRCLNLIKKCL